MKRTIRFKVLLLTSKKLLKPGTVVIGESPFYPFGDREVEDYIELLCASNIPFDVKYNDEISFQDIISDISINYNIIILALPEKYLTRGNVNIIKRVSHDFGVSIIASYNRVGELTREIFGIEKFMGRKLCFPCKITVDKNKFLDPYIESEIKLGDGWRIQFQRWGLRRHPIRYIKKHFKIFWEQVFCYMKVKVSPAVEVLSFIKNTTDPAIIKVRYGKAVNYYIALHSDFFLDRYNSLHRIVREFIRENSGFGMVNFDLGNTMILRMDDPGTCERVYLKGYDTRILTKKDWQKLIELLNNYNAKLSVMYIPLWVDDGNFENGKLMIKAKGVGNRKKGATYYSKDVVFIKNHKNGREIVYDYSSEFQALCEGILSDRIDIESHGLTHLDTNLDNWLNAKDRYSNLSWYHEFRHVTKNRDVAEKEQEYILRESAKIIENLFKISPSSIAPSGHEQSHDLEQITHRSGYKLFSSDYNSIEKDGHVIRNDKIKSIFLESVKPNYKFSSAGYPVVGVFHDYDVAKRGVGWLKEVINEWRVTGIDRFMTLRELVGYLGARINAFMIENEIHIEIDISRTGGVTEHPECRYFYNQKMVVDVYLPQGKKPAFIKVAGNSHQEYKWDRTLCRIKLILPAFGSRERQKIVVTMESSDISV